MKIFFFATGCNPPFQLPHSIFYPFILAFAVLKQKITQPAVYIDISIQGYLDLFFVK